MIAGICKMGMESAKKQRMARIAHVSKEDLGALSANELSILTGLEVFGRL